MRKLIPLFALAIAGCAGWGGAPVAEIRNIEWHAVDIGGRPTLPTQRPASLTLGARNAASGSGGCNQWSAQYRLEGNQLSFGQINSTRILCDGQVGEQENIFFSILNEADRYTVWQDGTLTIATPGGRTVSFRRP